MTGFVECGCCGASLYACSSSRGRRQPRHVSYVCTVHKQRRGAACASHGVSMLDADAAVLDTLDSHVLNPEVIRRAVDKVLTALSAPPPPTVDPATRRAALAALDIQLARPTEAVSLSGDSLPGLIREMQSVQRRRETLAAQEAPAPAPVDARRVRRDLDLRLADWKTILRRNVPQARQLIRKLLVRRLRFTPHEDGTMFEGRCSLGPLLQGIVSAATPSVAPTGLGIQTCSPQPAALFVCRSRAGPCRSVERAPRL